MLIAVKEELETPCTEEMAAFDKFMWYVEREAYRAMEDLRAAGIDTQFVVANQVLEEEYCSNDFFRKRRAMQEKYLSEINRLFQLPVTVMPLFETEITGLEMVEWAAEALFAGAMEKTSL
ncbi:MAG: ArsA-related P-loop ATPase [Spirochaetia bacterium]|nr:ArsA-related P-loop ATPase [Spirochaetia bacterium]